MEVLQRTANRGSIATGGYNIDNSCKFEKNNDSTTVEFFERNVSSAGSRTTGTFSAWIKKTDVTTAQYLFTFGNVDNDNGRTFARFQTDGTLRIGGGSTTWRNTNRVFRDTSAWYHIVIAFDTTQSTANDRFKLYVNGVQETSFSTTNNPSEDGTLGLNFGKQAIGYNTIDNNSGFNGYMAEVLIQDGTASAPTDFGEFDDDSGIWKPKDLSAISVGTNGTYLKFENAASMGAATSGNAFTVQNINQNDQATDTPTNNFCTLNLNTGYIQGSDATTFTQGATTRQGGSSSYNGALGTIGINPFVGSAKWYWEVELSANNSGDGIELGAGWLATSIIQSTTSDKATAGNNAGFQIWTSFNFDPPGEGTGADGDVFGFLLQCDSSNPNLKIYKNDTLFTTRHTATSYDFENDFYFPVVFIYNTGMKAFCNFGNPFDATVSSGNTDPNGYGNFEFDTKSGYALCTKNLAEYG